MFKKIISLILAICLLNTGTCVVSADIGPVASLSRAYGNAGEIVEIDLKIDDCDGFANLGFELEYDRSVLRLLKVENNTNVGAVCTPAQTYDTYPYNIGWDSTENVYFNGTLATFVFEILKNAPAGEHYISLSHYKGRKGDYIDGIAVNYDENDNPLNFTYNSGCVVVRKNITPSTPGGGGGGSNEPAKDETTAFLSNISGYQGDLVEVNLTLKNNTGFANLGLEILYDKDVLALMEVKNNTNVGAVCTTAQTIDTLPYNISWDSTQNINFNGVLATFVFKVSEGASIGKHNISLDYYKGRKGDYIDGVAVNYDENDNPLDLVYKSSYVEVLHKPLEKPESANDNSFNGSIYKVLESQLSWQDAKKLCEDAGGHLATITSAQENEFIHNLINNGEKEQYFIGATDTIADGMWSWVSGENFVYKNWSDGKPDNYGNSGAYLTIYKDTGKWNDEISSKTGHGFICEWEDESANKESIYWVEFVLKKEVYETGESFDASRDVQGFLYTDDSVIRIYDYTIEGFDSSCEGECDITVSYGDFSRNFTVIIADAVEVEPIVTHIVNAKASNGATISPQGYSEVENGSVMNYVIGAREGYYIESVTVNDEPVSITDSILSLEITQNTTILVSAKKKIFDVNINNTENGQILLSANKAEYGENCTAQIIPDTGYIVADVLVDGVSVGAVKTYTITNITQSHTITAVFEELIETLTVTAKYGEGGYVVPARSVINKGGSIRFNTVTDYGYQVSRILVNGEEKHFTTSLITLDNILNNTEIIVEFKKNIYSVSLNQQEGARLSVEYDGVTSDSANVPYLDTARIYVDVKEGYKLNVLYINNLAVKPVKENDKLVYRFTVTGSVTVKARCALTQTSEYNNKVALAGKPSDVTINNAYEKKQIFTELIEQYNKLSESEKVVCTSAYATVLASLNRADAYISLIKSDIVSAIVNLPTVNTLTLDNFTGYKENIDTVYVNYEKLNYLSKSFIDYEYVTKLTQLKEKADKLEKESQDLLDYLYGIIEKIPSSDSITKDNLSEAYSNLVLAENTYFELNDENKNIVAQDGMDLVLFEKSASISARIYEIYVAPFTSRVLRATQVVASDSISDAEAKRVTIYGLMDEYHTYVDFIREQISASTIQKLNRLYESASITVSSVVNNMPVDMNGDFDENVDLVLSEPDIDNTEISQATGKSVYQAIDVKMYSDNIEIQPSSKIRIKMEISIELSQSDVSIVYIDNNGNVFDVQGEVIEENGKTFIVFFIDHFSNFAVLYNEHQAPETELKLDKQTASVGDTVTATVTGALNYANVNVYIAGYSAQGNITFIKKASGNTASGVIADNTAYVKAMLWKKNMAPIVSDVSIPVVN